MSKGLATFQNLNEVAVHLREKLEDKKYILLFAYNGTGKTRLSTAFKELGKEDVYLMSENDELLLDENGEALLAEESTRDTLYFNAFTEDLFYWNNDLENDAERVLLMNRGSRFFDGLQELEMESRIRDLLHRYVDFDFRIDYEKWAIEFSRSQQPQDGDGMQDGGANSIVSHIKISRGEENLFIWCFFLAIAQLALDKQEDSPYEWVKYIYIDDPISSLDDNNAIQVASHLANMLKQSDTEIKFVISSHHALFFNVMYNELKSALKFMLSSHDGRVKYTLKDTTDTPFFHHVALLKLLNKAARRNELYTYHFSMLRNILERSASFHGFNSLADFIKRDANDDGILHNRIIQLLNHGGYSHFEPKEMIDENKQHFKSILNNFMRDYGFNPELFPAMEGEG